ncbi:MAG TPA: rod shape-determining protein MreD [Acidobacteria bacterium]|nr:rod shape-determining protein MreD [Acidobacteriota bacterium]
MKTAWVGLTLALALVLQTTVVPGLAGAGVPVDLVLVAVVLVAISSGSVGGLWVGTVGGLLQDALSGGVIGVGGLAKTLVGYAVGAFAVQFNVSRSWHQALVVLFASLVHAGCFVGLYSLLSDDGTITSYGGGVTQAVANAVVGGGVAMALGAAPAALTRRRLRRRRLTRRFGG